MEEKGHLLSLPSSAYPLMGAAFRTIHDKDFQRKVIAVLAKKGTVVIVRDNEHRQQHKQTMLDFFASEPFFKSFGDVVERT